MNENNGSEASNGLSMEQYKSARTSVGLTKIQLKMIEVLSDGKMHKVERLRECLSDELCTSQNVMPHLTAIRKILRQMGEDVALIRISGKVYYQKRPLPPMDDE